MERSVIRGRLSTRIALRSIRATTPHPPIRPVERIPPRVPYAPQQAEVLMPDSTNSLLAFSTAVADVVERTAKSVVAVAHGGRGTISGIHWRPGVIVTA